MAVYDHTGQITYGYDTNDSKLTASNYAKLGSQLSQAKLRRLRTTQIIILVTRVRK